MEPGGTTPGAQGVGERLAEGDRGDEALIHQGLVLGAAAFVVSWHATSGFWVLARK